MATWLKGFERRATPFQGLGYYPCYDTKGGTVVPWPMATRPLLVLHSTEGDGVPTYSGGKSNPHFTLDPWRSRKYQHVPCNVASRALAGADRDVHCRAIQVEIVGWCSLSDAKKAGKEKTRLLDVMTDAQRKWLGQALREIAGENAIPAKIGVDFKAYNSGIAPSSYGTSNGVRLSKAAYLKYEGWLGHQHVPFNVHGDPGDLDVARLLRLSTPAVATPQAQGRYPVPTRVLKLGSKGEDVKWVQDGLKSRYRYGKHLVVDGSYGHNTVEAVKEFQRRTHIGVDGSTGPQTRATMKKEWGA